MKQDFTFSKFVLSELNYTDNEIKQIIETLQRGDFAYVGKKEYPAIRDNDIWRKDNVSGIDVPVLWTPDTGITNETILLLAQDPLRDTDYWDETFCHDFTCTKENRNKYVVVGTPYALHYFSDGNFKATQLSNGKRKSWRVKIYYNLIRSIVEMGYNVYCTDIFKYYFLGHKYKVCDFDKKILGDEVTRLKEQGPLRVLCMGKKAHDGIVGLQGVDKQPVNVPHVRARNWGLNTDAYKIKFICDKLSTENQDL